MGSDQKSTETSQEIETSSLDLPTIAPGDEPLEHPEPSFAQRIAHAKLLLSWQDDDFLEKRRALMQAERFVLE